MAGRTNKTIAAELYIAEKTVELHLDHIYTKIGGRTRIMAGIWALQQVIEIDIFQSFRLNIWLFCI
jgi:DNA-binding NarL/FixJ family response regulator